MTLKRPLVHLLLVALAAATSLTATAFGQPPDSPTINGSDVPKDPPSENTETGQPAEPQPIMTPVPDNQPSQAGPEHEDQQTNQQPVPTYRYHGPARQTYTPPAPKVVKVGDARSTINAALRTTRLRRNKKTGEYSLVTGAPETALLVETAMERGYTEGIGGWRLGLKASVTDEQCAALLNRQSYVVRTETRKLRETVSAMKSEVGQLSTRVDAHEKELTNLTGIGEAQKTRLAQQEKLINDEVVRAKKQEVGLGDEITAVRSQTNGHWWWLLILTLGSLLLMAAVTWMIYQLWELIRPKGFSAPTIITKFKKTPSTTTATPTKATPSHLPSPTPAAPTTAAPPTAAP